MSTCLMSMYTEKKTFFPKELSPSTQQENIYIEKPTRLIKGQLSVLNEEKKLNLFNKIKESALKVVRSLKIKKLLVFSAIGLGFFLIPGTNGQALAVEMVEEVVGHEKGDSNILQKAKIGFMTATSLKDMLDPTCPMPKRLVASAKFTCCTSAIVSFTIAEAAGMGKIPAHIKAKATMCCGTSILVLGRIQAIEANKNKVTLKTIILGNRN